MFSREVLPEPLLPHDGDKLPVGHREVEVVEEGHLRDGAGIVDFRQVLQLKHG